MNETITYIRKSLEPLYPPEEIRSLTEWILEKACNLSRNQQILRKDTQLSNAQSDSIQSIVRRMQNSEPIQYIFGVTEFLGLTFEVSPAVLIPRPETEELVHRILKDIKVVNDFKDFKIINDLNNPTILDIGTGSGCIAITLAKHLMKACVFALDISTDALQIAQRNAQQNNVTVHFFQADILSANMQHDTSFPQFDLIVSNPPYVLSSEKSFMKPNVLDYEPHSALFVPDDDPILFYRHIADFAMAKLTTNGILYCEINPSCSEMIVSMLNQKGFIDIEIYNDLSGKERFIKASK